MNNLYIYISIYSFSSRPYTIVLSIYYILLSSRLIIFLFSAHLFSSLLFYSVIFPSLLFCYRPFSSILISSLLFLYLPSFPLHCRSFLFPPLHFTTHLSFHLFSSLHSPPLFSYPISLSSLVFFFPPLTLSSQFQYRSGRRRRVCAPYRENALSILWYLSHN